MSPLCLAQLDQQVTLEYKETLATKVIQVLKATKVIQECKGMLGVRVILVKQAMVLL
jgi:hypothetical protein